MCGILGIINQEGYDKKHTNVCAWLAQYLYVGTLRGSDSTGMFQVPRYVYSKNKEPFRVRKLPISGPYFLGDKQAKEMINAADSALVTIGHHRAATHGTVSPENAHPFVHGSKSEQVVGVHNGTLHAYDRVNFDVDSDWLYSKIQQEGAEKALSGVNGAYALVWYEQATNRLRIASNDQRKIFWMPVVGSNIALIGSEHEMIYALAARNGIKLEGVYTTKPGMIFSWELDGKADVRTSCTVQRIEEPPARAITSTASTSSGGTTGPFRERGTTSGNKTIGPGTTSNEYTNGSRSVIDDHKGHTIISDYGKDTTSLSLEDMGFSFGEEVEFCTSMDAGGCSGPNDKAGYIAPDFNDPEMRSYGEAVMVGATPQVLANIEEGAVTRCRVIGHRRVIDKAEPTKSRDFVLISQPFVIEHRQGTYRTTEEDEDGSEDYGPSLADMEDLKFIEGPRRKLLTEKQFNELTKDGCSCCGTNLTVDDAQAGLIMWAGANNDPTCVDCYQSYIAEAGRK